MAGRSNIVISTGAKTVSEIRAESRHMGFDVIVIDYLQLIRSDTFYRGNRVAEVGAISKAIKALAMELQIPIILLSQLNRASEGRETREPSMEQNDEWWDEALREMDLFAKKYGSTVFVRKLCMALIARLEDEHQEQMAKGKERQR